MHRTTGRVLAVIGASAVFGGQCGCQYMSDQVRDYPCVDPTHPTIVLFHSLAATAAASAAPAVNSMIDNRRLNEATGKKWYQRKTTRDYVRVALTCKNADIRRFAVVKISGGPDVTSDWVFEALEKVARRDSSSSARWAAIRGLQRIHDLRSLRLALDILNCGQDTDYVRRPGARVRWGCLLLLVDYCARGLVPDNERDAVRDVLVRHLSECCHHDVRYTAVMGLGYFDNEVSRNALNDALDDDHLGVALGAGRSLQAIANRGGIAHEEDLP